VNISLLALSSTAGLLFFREKRISGQAAQKHNNNNSSCNSSSNNSSGNISISSSSGKSNSINISFSDSEASPKLSKLRKVFLLANLLALLGIIYFNYTVKKVNCFPIHSRDVTNQTFPGWE
jgi:hypothetical protein